MQTININKQIMRPSLLKSRGRNATTDNGSVNEKNQSLIGRIKEVCPASKALKLRDSL